MKEIGATEGDPEDFDVYLRGICGRLLYFGFGGGLDKYSSKSR